MVIRSGEVYTLAWEADTLIDVSACLANLFKDLGQSGVRQVCTSVPLHSSGVLRVEHARHRYGIPYAPSPANPNWGTATRSRPALAVGRLWSQGYSWVLRYAMPMPEVL